MTHSDIPAAGKRLTDTQRGYLRLLTDINGAPMQRLLLDVVAQTPNSQPVGLEDVDVSIDHPAQREIVKQFLFVFGHAFAKAFEEPLPMTDTALAQRLHASAELLKEGMFLNDISNPTLASGYLGLAQIYDAVCVEIFSRVCVSRPVPRVAPPSRWQ